MNAYDFLNSLQTAEIDLKNKKAELHRLEMLETDITAPLTPDKVQSSGNKDKLGTLIANRIDFEREEVEKAEALFVKRLEDVTEVLKEVKKISFQQYNTLFWRYVNYCNTLSKVAKVTHYSYSSVKIFHREGIENVQKILNLEKD